MKVFITGDYRTGTGPANVTKEYIACLPEFTKKVTYQKFTGKIMRAVEMLFKTACCDVILFSGYSRQNLLGMKLAGIFKKKSVYLMHGCVEHENEINGVPDEEMNKCERATVAGCDAILAVSGRFANWVRQHYPESRDKLDFVTNGCDGLKAGTPKNKSGNVIFSIGGGMPRKKIKYICKAIERLNAQGHDYKLVVVGDEGIDTDEINKYPFVTNLGIVSHEKVRELFETSDIFVQNSCFETFGLSPVEALVNGCSVLLSNEVGALDIIGSATESDIIYAYNDIDEIVTKIPKILAEPNGQRLLESIDFELYSWRGRSRELSEKLRKIVYG